jgi:Zn-dependent peptidase ImmA (M78 family)
MTLINLMAASPPQSRLSMINLSDNPASPILWRLISLAAPIIAGRDCIVKRRDPTAGNYGETSVNLEGVPVVAIAEDLQGDNLTATLLHELAHVKLHAAKMQRSNTENEPPNSDPNHKNRPEWELEADSQALGWVRYGMANRDLNLPKDAGVLLALVDLNLEGVNQ